MRLWDIEGRSLATFEAFGVVGAMELSDGTLLSWTSDSPTTCGGVYRWDRKGNLLWSAHHDTGIRGVIELPGLRILSWSGSNFYGKTELDNTLKLWDLRGSPDLPFSRRKSPLVTYMGHRYVYRAHWLADGSIVSWGDSVRRWSADGRQTAWPEWPRHGDDREGLFAWARGQGFDPNVLYAESEEPNLGSSVMSDIAFPRYSFNRFRQVSQNRLH
jgi:WD40 repeat protein